MLCYNSERRRNDPPHQIQNTPLEATYCRKSRRIINVFSSSLQPRSDMIRSHKYSIIFKSTRKRWAIIEPDTIICTQYSSLRPYRRNHGTPSYQKEIKYQPSPSLLFPAEGRSRNDIMRLFYATFAPKRKGSGSSIKFIYALRLYIDIKRVTLPSQS